MKLSDVSTQTAYLYKINHSTSDTASSTSGSSTTTGTTDEAGETDDVLDEATAQQFTHKQALVDQLASVVAQSSSRKSADYEINLSSLLLTKLETAQTLLTGDSTAATESSDSTTSSSAASTDSMVVGSLLDVSA